jgi:hypothetical protein
MFFINNLTLLASNTSEITSITYFVVALALIFGIVNIKDYFFYKKGISFTIPDKYKPKLFKKTRDLIKVESNWILAFSTFLLAAGVAIIELPCTAGLPLIWSSIVASSAQTSFYAYLAIYLFVYLLIEIIILLTVIITLKSFKMTEFKGRVLKLIGGVLIVALGLVLLIDSSLMYNMVYALYIIFGALLLSGLIILIERGIKKLK